MNLAARKAYLNDQLDALTKKYRDMADEWLDGVGDKPPELSARKFQEYREAYLKESAPIVEELITLRGFDAPT